MLGEIQFSDLLIIAQFFSIEGNYHLTIPFALELCFGNTFEGFYVVINVKRQPDWLPAFKFRAGNLNLGFENLDGGSFGNELLRRHFFGFLSLCLGVAD